MDYLIRFLKTGLLGAVIFGLLGLLILCAVAFNWITISIHGWAWPIFLMLAVIFACLNRALMDYLGNLLYCTAWEPPVGLAIVLRHVGYWVEDALALFITAAIVPHLVMYAPASTILVLAVICGIGCGLFDRIVSHYIRRR